MKGFELWGGLLKVSYLRIEVIIPHISHHKQREAEVALNHFAYVMIGQN
jgi:hypothetical protein